MTARTSSGSGLFSAVVGTCVNGDTFTIQSGHNVTLDVDLSGLTTGLGASTINGVLDCKADVATGLFMNGNLDVNGALYIANRAVMSGFTLTEGKSNVYEIARTLMVATVEETLGISFKEAWKELKELAIDIENSRLRGLGQNEMLPDACIDYAETYKASLTLTDYLNYVQSTSGSFYHDTTNNKLYIHSSDNSNPSTKTITVIEPIQRPSAGSSARCQIKFNASAIFTNTGGGTPVLHGFGWHPEREWAKLSNAAALNDTILPVENNLDIQQGDIIVIGSGTEVKRSVESNKGNYTISEYNTETKVLTLTDGLQTARLSGDYITIYNRPIKIFRSSGAATIVNSELNIEFEGVLVVPGAGAKFVTDSTTSKVIKAGKYSHCTSDSYFATHVQSITTRDCVSKGYQVYDCQTVDIRRCIAIQCQAGGCRTLYRKGNSIINAVVYQNAQYPIISCEFPIKNCSFNEYSYMGMIFPTIYENCEFKGHNGTDITGTFEDIFSTCYAQGNKYFNCKFKGTGRYYFKAEYAKAYNCIFDDDVALVSNSGYKHASRRPDIPTLESYNHNGIIGNYLLLCKGGKIETIDDKLKFICESNDYPVFRDYPILAPANRTIKRLIGLTKSTPEIVTKLQFIDPANDPLINSTATPLAESSEIVNNQIGVSYKSDTAKQIILRIYCQNSTGNVVIDTTRIDQSLAKRIK